MSSSAGSASTPSSSRYRFSMRSMKKLPPTNVWRLKPSAVRQHRGHRRAARRPGHVARLAASLVSSTRCAATPGTAPARAAIRRLAPSVQRRRCTACGTSRTAPTAACARLQRLHPGGRLHEAGAGLASTGTGRRSGAPSAGTALTTKPPVKLSARPQPIRSNLMADRARHAVGSETICSDPPRAMGKCAKTSPCPPRRSGERAGHRHVADGTFVLDAPSSTGDRLLRAGPRPASTDRARSWPSSTRASRPDRDVVTGRRLQAVVARHAVVRGLKLGAFPDDGRLSRVDSAARACSGTARCHTRGCNPAAIVVSRSLPPAIEESAIEPVPQQVGQHLHVALAPTRQRDLQSCAHQDVLAPAQRHLHLRHDVPLGASPPPTHEPRRIRRSATRCGQTVPP